MEKDWIQKFRNKKELIDRISESSNYTEKDRHFMWVDQIINIQSVISIAKVVCTSTVVNDDHEISTITHPSCSNHERHKQQSLHCFA